MQVAVKLYRRTYFLECLLRTKCPLNFNKLGRIKFVHHVFIFKYISHWIADYTSTANLSVNVGVRMPVNPSVDPAIGNQVSVFFIKHLSFWSIQICYLYF